MVETCVGPSELHLKKELSALRKARCLRDPETCSSWRSPLSSRSVAAASSLNYGNWNRGYLTGGNNSGGLLEVKSNSSLPLRNENRRKKVYLYNWGRHSCKSSDNVLKLDEDNRQGSVQGSTEGRLSNPQKADSKSDTYLEDPVLVFRVKRTNPETPVSTVRKLRRSAVSKQRIVRKFAISKLPDLPSSSFGALDSIGPSDDTECCNSDDLRHSTQELIRKTGYASCSASSLLSGSGCVNLSRSSKILRNTRRVESSYSCTPASTSSYNRYGHQHPSTVGSWDGTTASFDGDELDQMELARRHGCGIPCYSSKRVKDGGCGGWYSPSLSDTLRRKGSSILCGSQTLNHKRKSSGAHKQKFLSKDSQGLPLLTNSCDGGRSSVDTVSDDLLTNFEELDLEALSRLDGSRWSNCRSQEGLELAFPVGADGEMPDHRSLSQKYRPMYFDEIIGQNIVVQSLHNAILRGRIAPAYLFQGPRGTGKTSTARIFAAALNCLSTKENKPCGFCRECTDFASGNGSNVREIDATNKKGIDRIRYLLKNMSTATTFSQYKVFVIDKCHVLSSKVWSVFIKFLEEPPLRVVFVFITIDPGNLPHAILSCCQKYLFPKIKDVDVVSRLRKLSAEASFDVELDALDLIALNSDGSLGDAETMLDQLSLLGKRITTSLVNDLVGVVSDEKLLDLLEIAMSSDTAETVRRSRELMDSGVDPVALMSQLAGLIMDIIAGTYQLATSKSCDSVLGGRSLTEAELDRLQQALKILSDAEKQLRLSSERSTWFTAALLQLGSGHSPELNHSSGSSSKHGARKAKLGTIDREKEALVYDKSDALLKARQSSSASVLRVVNGHSSPHANPSSSMSIRKISSEVLPLGSQSAENSLLAATHKEKADGKSYLTKISPDKLDEIWRRCIKRCHSKTLRHLLCAHGKLISISEARGVLNAFIAFGDENVKSRAEGFLSSITNSMEIVLGQNVEIRIGSLPDNYMNGTGHLPDSSTRDQTKIIGLLDKERKTDPCNSNCSSDKDPQKETLNLPTKSIDYSEGKMQRTLDICEISRVPNESVQVASLPIFPSEENGRVCSTEDAGQEVPVQRTHTAVVDEQMSESAWLHWLEVGDKGTPGLATCLKPERNQILPQNDISQQNQNEYKMALTTSSKHWEDELNHEIKALKISGNQGHRKEQIRGRVGQYAICPSLLHSNSFPANFDRENLGYESGPGCNGLLCWKTSKHHRRKVKQGTRVRSQKTGRLSWFGHCGKSKD